MGDDIHAELKKLLNERIVVLDGAMGTTIREYGLDEVLLEVRGLKQLKNIYSTMAIFSQSPKVMLLVIFIVNFLRQVQTLLQLIHFQQLLWPKVSSLWMIPEKRAKG